MIFISRSKHGLVTDSSPKGKWSVRGGGPEGMSTPVASGHLGLRRKLETQREPSMHSNLVPDSSSTYYLNLLGD